MTSIRETKPQTFPQNPLQGNQVADPPSSSPFFETGAVRDQYDGRLGLQEVSYTLKYGFTAANKPMLERIVAPVSV